MGKADQYREHMRRLGTYDPAFEPEIADLCTLERERTAARKQWKATAQPGKKPSFNEPIYRVIKDLDSAIRKSRHELGFTVKGLEALRSRRVSASETDPPPSTGNAAFTDLLNSIQEATRAGTP